MNRRCFFTRLASGLLAVAAPTLFLPKLIKPKWKTTTEGLIVRAQRIFQPQDYSGEWWWIVDRIPAQEMSFKAVQLYKTYEVEVGDH